MRVGPLARAALSAVAVVAGVGFSASGERVTAAAVWNPDAGFMQRFHKQCDGRPGAAFDGCFAVAMASAGAAQAALEFTRRLDNEAYLQDLNEYGGPVALAHVFYPFRANENSAWFLVNGTPALIDIDDQRYLALAAMRDSVAYGELHRRYPNVTLWPGDRGVSAPQPTQSEREFVIDYLLRDQCHACAIVGRVRFAFDFDAVGKFLGARLISVTAAER
jgi:hypothetical protein